MASCKPLLVPIIWHVLCFVPSSVQAAVTDQWTCNWQRVKHHFGRCAGGISPTKGREHGTLRAVAAAQWQGREIQLLNQSGELWVDRNAIGVSIT